MLDLSKILASVSERAQEAINSAVCDKLMRVSYQDAAAGEPAELLIDGEIGDPYRANDSRSVAQFLRQNRGAPIHVRINSPGGSVFDGLSIHNALSAHNGPVTTTIEALAASAASIISLAGKPSRMFENAQFMMHFSGGAAFGNKFVQRELADILDSIDESLAITYQAKTRLPKAKLLKMMEGEGKKDGTWMNAKEAKSLGFVDEIVRAGEKAEASLPEAIVRQAKREEARREFLNRA